MCRDQNITTLMDLMRRMHAAVFIPVRVRIQLSHACILVVFVRHVVFSSLFTDVINDVARVSARTRSGSRERWYVLFCSLVDQNIVVF